MAAMTWTTTCSRSLSGSTRRGWQLSSAARSTGRPHWQWDPPSRTRPRPPRSSRPGWLGPMSREGKQKLHDRLAVQAATIDPGPAGLKIALTTGPGRNWANLWKPLIDAFGPVLGEDLTRPFHPHDDRIVSLGLHHTIDTGIAHDVIIDAWWTSL